MKNPSGAAFNQGARGSNPRWLTKKIPLTMRLEGFFVMSEKAFPNI